MIFTPEERRAILSLLALLLVGEVLGAIDSSRRAKPDRELSAWFDRLAWIDADSIGSTADSIHARSSANADSGSMIDPARWVQGSTMSIAGSPAASAGAVALERGDRSRERGSAETRGSDLPPPVRAERIERAAPGILSGTRIRIADATAEDLDALPSVGPSLAKRMIEERDRAPLLEPNDLLRVSGIGPKKLALLAPLLDFSPAPGLQGATAPACSLQAIP